MELTLIASIIKQRREEKGMTQAELAAQIGVTDKAVSKWETAKGLPDLFLLEKLAETLEVSVTELMQGNAVVNRNKSSNLLHTSFYVCLLCGNILHSTGEAVISCCGIVLPVLEADALDSEHLVHWEKVEDDYFITAEHPMTKQHYLSFMAWITWDRFQLVKLYPESSAKARFPARGKGILYLYCNRHGLKKLRIG